MNKFSDFEKIMQVLDAKGISQSKAESLLGLGVGTIGKMKKRKKGDGSLHDDNTEKFLRMFMVNPEWWKTAEGEMFLKESPAVRAEGTITMPMDVWEVIKGSNKIHEASHKIFELEFERLWGLIEKFGPTAPSLNKDPIIKNGN